MAGEHAQISLRRTGGLVGRPLEATLDTRELAPEQAKELIGALDRVNLDRIKEGKDWSAGAADTFRYDLKVDRGKTTRSVSFSDRQLPAELTPVVRALMDRAQPGAA
jgi:hypothetical protein